MNALTCFFKVFRLYLVLGVTSEWVVKNGGIFINCKQVLINVFEGYAISGTFVILNRKKNITCFTNYVISNDFRNFNG